MYRNKQLNARKNIDKHTCFEELLQQVLQRYQDEFWLAGHKYVRTALDRISETRNMSMMTGITQAKFLSTTRVYSSCYV